MSLHSKALEALGNQMHTVNPDDLNNFKIMQSCVSLIQCFRFHLYFGKASLFLGEARQGRHSSSSSLGSVLSDTAGLWERSEDIVRNRVAG